MLRPLKAVVSCQLSVVRKEAILCLSSAVLLFLSFPNFNIEFFAWFAFVPLFFALQNKSKRRAFFLAYLTGVIFWFGTIYWLIHVTLPGLILLVLYLALYFGIFGILASLVTGYWLLVTLPSIWVILEYLRSHLFTGFPWALLGYSQYLNLPIIQIADITGVWGVSFLVMMANIMVKEVLGFRYLVLGKKEEREKIYPVILYLFLFVSTMGYGYYKLHQTPNTQHQTPIRLSVVQGNIPQELKWQPEAKDFIIQKYLNLTAQAAKDSPDLILWPEAALPVVLEEEPIYFEKVKTSVRENKIPLVFGAPTLRNNLFFNSAILVSPEGTLNRYDKLHLVPFGEFIPFRKLFPFLETVVPIGDFTAGKEYTILEIPNPKSQIPNKSQIPISKIPNKFSVLICFEDLFPELSREFVRRGADFLINITNDAWFKKTSSPYQHLSASVFRAVENRAPVVRAANTGVSGFIAPTGKIISLVQDELGRNIFVDGYKTQEIYIDQRDLSFYTRYGDSFILLCLVFVIYNIVNSNIKHQISK